MMPWSKLFSPQSKPGPAVYPPGPEGFLQALIDFPPSLSYPSRQFPPPLKPFFWTHGQEGVSQFTNLLLWMRDKAWSRHEENPGEPSDESHFNAFLGLGPYTRWLIDSSAPDSWQRLIFFSSESGFGFSPTLTQAERDRLLDYVDEHFFLQIFVTYPIGTPPSAIPQLPRRKTPPRPEVFAPPTLEERWQQLRDRRPQPAIYDSGYEGYLQALIDFDESMAYPSRRVPGPLSGFFWRYGHMGLSLFSRRVLTWMKEEAETGEPPRPLPFDPGRNADSAMSSMVNFMRFATSSALSPFSCSGPGSSPAQEISLASSIPAGEQVRLCRYVADRYPRPAAGAGAG